MAVDMAAEVVAAVDMEAVAAAVGVIEHSIQPHGQEAFSTGLLDRPVPIIAHRSDETQNSTESVEYDQDHAWTTTLGLRSPTVSCVPEDY